ncbi:MAG: CstA-like transporter-associated (seleno)protein [Steroidobacteraceae bacterium]
MKRRLLALAARTRRLVGRLNGDAAYERFVAHRCSVHPGEPLPSRREFWCGEVERKWQGIHRCC